MNDLHSILARLSGFDVNKEVINLWYEVTYLRFLLTNILKSNPEMEKLIKEEEFDKARVSAQEFLVSKFPNMGVKFDTTVESESSSSESQS